MKQHSFLALEQALGGYLHQDYLSDYSSFDEAINAFVASEPKELVDSARKELSQFVDLTEETSTLGELLLQLGCYYDPVADGMTVRDWLREVEGILAFSAPSRSSHPYTQVPNFMAQDLRNIKED